MTRVCVIGIWHQGAVASACLADLGYEVIGVDADSERVAHLNTGRAPLYEPGLDELLLKGIKAGRLCFTTDMRLALQDTRDIIVAFDTPVDVNDAVDLTEIFQTATTLAPYLEPNALILVTAQVPVGTCERIAAVIREINPKADFGIAYSPENLRLGQAIERFKIPPLPVFGADQQETLDRVQQLLSPLPVQWMRVDLRTAEMAKHALNAFLAMSICFANEMGNLCDAVGADAWLVAQALRLEPRIGAKAMLLPGLGFSGGTLARDLRTLQHLGDMAGYDTCLLDGAWETNQRQNRLVVQRLQQYFGSLGGLTVGVLGLTYKPDTSTLRRSASIEVIQDMVGRGAQVKAYDPKADQQELHLHTVFQVCEDPYMVAQDADVLVLMTPWAEFKYLDYGRIKVDMKQAVFFDPQNVLDMQQMKDLGFVYLGVGRGRSGGKGESA